MNLIKRFIAAIIGSLFVVPKAFPNVNLGNTPAQMLITGAVRKAVHDSVVHDVDYTLDDIMAKELTNVVKPGKENQIQPPQSDMFFQVPTSEYGHSVIIKCARDLQEAPIVGDNELPGTEENVRMLYGRLYYNMVSKAVAMRGYGNEFKELDDAGAYKVIPLKQRKFNTEYRGLSIRKAAMLEVEDILTDSFSGCVQRFCSNIFISNLSPGNQPVYDATALTVTNGAADSLGYYSSRTFSGASTYVESIGEKLIEASGLTSAPVSYPTVRDIERYSFWLSLTVKMQKIKIGSEFGYPLYMNPWQYDYLSRFDGEFATAMRNAHDFCDANSRMNHPGLMGKIKDVFLFLDSRGPTWTLTGTTGSYAIQPGWVNPGNNDDRNASDWSVASGSQNLVFDVAWTVGAGGLCERIVTSEKDLTETQSYGYRKGRGNYMQRGIQTVKWDCDTPDDANDSNSTGLGKTLMQRNVALFVTCRPASGTLRATS